MDEWSSPDFLSDPEAVAKRDREWLASRGVTDVTEYAFSSKGAYVGEPAWCIGRSYVGTPGARVFLPSCVHVQDPWKEGRYRRLMSEKDKYYMKYGDSTMWMGWLEKAVDNGLCDESAELKTIALCDALSRMQGRVFDALVALGADVNMAVPVGNGTSERMTTPLMEAVYALCRRYDMPEGGMRASAALGYGDGGDCLGTSCRHVMAMDALECLLSHGASPMEAVLYPVERGGSMRPKSSLVTMAMTLRKCVGVTARSDRQCMDDREVAASSVSLCAFVEDMAYRFPGFLQMLECAGCPTNMYLYVKPVSGGKEAELRVVDSYAPAQFATAAMYSGCRTAMDLVSGLGLAPMVGKPFAVCELQSAITSSTVWGSREYMHDHGMPRSLLAAFESCTVPAGPGRNTAMAAASLVSTSNPGDEGMSHFMFHPDTGVDSLLNIGDSRIGTGCDMSLLDTATAYGLSADSTAPWCEEGRKVMSEHDRYHWVHGSVHSIVACGSYEDMSDTRCRRPYMYALESGANLEHRRDGLTPLLYLVHEFASGGSSSKLRTELLGVAGELLEYGADPNALAAACDAGRFVSGPIEGVEGMDAIGIMVWTLKRIRDNDTLFQRARYNDCVALVTLLVCNGLSTEHRGPDGKFPEEGWQHPLAMFLQAMRKKAAVDRLETFGEPAVAAPVSPEEAQAQP